MEAMMSRFVKNPVVSLARAVDELWARSNAFHTLSPEHRVIIEDAVKTLEVILEEDAAARAELAGVA